MIVRTFVFKKVGVSTIMNEQLSKEKNTNQVCAERKDRRTK